MNSAFFHPDYTVGSGVTPDHAMNMARGLYHRSGINVWNVITLPRRLFDCYSDYNETVEKGQQISLLEFYKNHNPLLDVPNPSWYHFRVRISTLMLRVLNYRKLP